jgi:hypothetical protein
VHWTGAGNLLTAPYPQGSDSWMARSKDHSVVDPSEITSYVIGIRSKTGVVVTGSVTVAQSAPSELPSASVAVQAGFTMTGGGAFDDWNPPAPGNLLTASFPASASSWQANGKDQTVVSPAPIFAYAIGIQ